MTDNPKGSSGAVDRRRSSRGRIFLVTGSATMAVVGLTLIVVYHPEKIKLDGNLDARGNVLGAIFSGLAFVGLVTTILLQMDELRMQREELELTRTELRRSAEAQIQSTEQHRLDSLRQASEQYLAARLNGTVALLQAEEASIRLAAEHTPKILKDATGLQVARLRQQVALLLGEARVRRGPNLPESLVEKEAVRVALTETLEDVLECLMIFDVFGERETVEPLAEQLHLELKLLKSQIEARYPALAGQLEVIRMQRRAQEDKGDYSIKTFAEWIRSFLRKTTNPTDAMWTS